MDRIGTSSGKDGTLWDPLLIFHHPSDVRSIALPKKLTLMFLVGERIPQPDLNWNREK
jgi:hypothetical protein